MADRPHSNIRSFFQFKRNLRVECLAEGFPGQIDSACTGTDPAGSIVKPRCIVSIFPAADSYLTEIIYPGPDKVSDQPWFPLSQFPEFIRIRAESFRPKDQPIRILFQVSPVPFFSVVVSGDVHVGKCISGCHVRSVQSCSELHEVRTH